MDDNGGGANGRKGRLTGMHGRCTNCCIPAMDVMLCCTKRTIMFALAICAGRAGVAINSAVKSL
jgi:hypothetical protein